MTDFVDGYDPTLISGETYIGTSYDTVKIVLTAPDGVGLWAQELEDALVAGQAAIKTSLESSFPGHTAASTHKVEGRKNL